MGDEGVVNFDVWGLGVFSLTPSVEAGGMILRGGGVRGLKVAKVGADVQISLAYFQAKRKRLQ